MKLTMLDLAHVENYMQKLVVRLVSASYCKQHQNTMRAAREKTYKQRQHPCSSEDGNVCDNVSKICQDACSSGSQGGVERFKTFKKDGFDAPCGHTGRRNTPRISKDFQKEAVRGRVKEGTAVLLSFSVVHE